MSFVQLAAEFSSSYKITNNATSVSARGSSEPGVLLSPALPLQALLHSYHVQSSPEKSTLLSSGRLYSVFHMMVTLLLRALCNFCNPFLSGKASFHQGSATLISTLI